MPSLAFYHIPAHAMLLGQQSGRLDPHRTPGANRERVNPQGTGDWTYDSQDVKFMEALLKTEGLIAGFSGHDHQNDWYELSVPFDTCTMNLLLTANRCFKWDGSLVDHDLTGNGINMCYGRHTGYGGYGDLTRGGRQILLNESNLAEDTQTWIRLEDGIVQAHVTLNTTYGQDTYTAVTNVGRPSVHTDSSLLPLSWLWFPVMMLWRWNY